MKNKTTKALLLGVVILLNETTIFAQNLQWARSYNGTCGVNGRENGKAVTKDASGNVYVTGSACGQGYLVTVKYNAAGIQQWATPYDGGGGFGNGYWESGFAIEVDGSGNVWVAAATFNGTANNYYNDLTLIKYNSAGIIQTNYPKKYQDASGTLGSFNYPRGTCIAVYDANNVYIGGQTYSTSTGWKLIVLKDDPSSANWGWSNTPYTYQGSWASGAHSATDIKINSNNTALYVTGYISNGNTNDDWLTAKINPSNGSQIWATPFNGSGWDKPNALAINIGGNVYVAGNAYNAALNATNGLLIKYNSSGAQQWASYSGTSAFTTWNDIDFKYNVTGAPTDIFVGGYIAAGTGNNDFILANYTDAGALTTSWGTNPVFYDGAAGVPESSGTDWGYGVEYSSGTDRVYISGSSWEIVNAVNTVNITSRGYNAANGSNVWSKSYDYGSDNLVQDDQMFLKYSLKVKYNSTYCIDEIFVTGTSVVVNQNENYITLKYGCGSNPACQTCAPPPDSPDPGRWMEIKEDYLEQGVYPNPFSTNAILNVNHPSAFDNAVLSVYDISGKLVLSINNITSTTVLIDRSGLKKGIYFYLLSENENILGNGKFVITD